MPVSSSNTSLALLALSCGVLVLLHVLRGGGSSRVRTMWLGAAFALAVVLAITHSFVTTVQTYPKAENHRFAAKAARDLTAGIDQCDAVLVLDGSSVFAHGLPEDLITNELQKLGHHVCVISLSLPGADHFERECMAEDVWALLPAPAREQVHAKRVVWLKELHWTYEAYPARFIARDLQAQRIQAQCDPERAPRMVSALLSNWKDECKNEKLKGTEAWKEFPLDRIIAVMRLGLVNLFHTGQLERLLDGPVNTELSALREDDVAPLPTEFVRSFWSDRPLPDEPLRPSISTRPHRWFNELMRRTPSGWPPLSNLQVVRYQPPSYGKTERRYSAQWTNAKSTIIGNADSKLLHSLDHVQLWRDPFHMERAGAELLAPWLAQQLTPYLGQPKH